MAESETLYVDINVGISPEMTTSYLPGAMKNEGFQVINTFIDVNKPRGKPRRVSSAPPEAKNQSSALLPFRTLQRHTSPHIVSDNNDVLINAYEIAMRLCIQEAHELMLKETAYVRTSLEIWKDKLDIMHREHSMLLYFENCMRKKLEKNEKEYIYQAIWIDLPIKVCLLLPPYDLWIRCGDEILEETLEMPPNTLAGCDMSRKTLMNLGEIASVLKKHKKYISRGLVFFTQQLYTYWYVDPKGNLRQINIMETFSIIETIKSPCFYIGRLRKTKQYCFVVPCHLCHLSAVLDISSGYVQRCTDKAGHVKISANVRSLYLREPTKNHAKFHVRMPKVFKNYIAATNRHRVIDKREDQVKNHVKI